VNEFFFQFNFITVLFFFCTKFKFYEINVTEYARITLCVILAQGLRHLEASRTTLSDIMQGCVRCHSIFVAIFKCGWNNWGKCFSLCVGISDQPCILQLSSLEGDRGLLQSNSVLHTKLT
jgi:hypothetical protein